MGALSYPPSKARTMHRTLAAAIILTLTLLTSPHATAQPAPHGLRPAPRVIVEMSHAEALHRLHVAQLFAILKRHHDAELYRAWMAYAAAHAPKPTGYGYVDGILVCNGTTLPTCHIVARESGFNPRAENPISTASGLYQFIDGTFRTCRTGYGHASYAPVAVQVECARIIWDNGRGSGNWALTR